MTKDDKVGYRNPPKAHRFKKGASGNPRGRPPKEKSHKAICDKLLGKEIKILQGGKALKVSAFEAILLAQLQLALKGDTKAASLILRLMKYVQDLSSPESESPVYFYIPDKPATIEDWQERFRPKTAENNIKDLER